MSSAPIGLWVLGRAWLTALDSILRAAKNQLRWRLRLKDFWGPGRWLLGPSTGMAQGLAN